MYILKEIMAVPVYIRLAAQYLCIDRKLVPVFVVNRPELQLVDKTLTPLFIRLDNNASR